jgi:hypothetical protein
VLPVSVRLAAGGVSTPLFGTFTLPLPLLPLLLVAR